MKHCNLGVRFLDDQVSSITLACCFFVLVPAGFHAIDHYQKYVYLFFRGLKQIDCIDYGSVLFEGSLPVLRGWFTGNLQRTKQNQVASFLDTTHATGLLCSSCRLCDIESRALLGPAEFI